MHRRMGIIEWYDHDHEPSTSRPFNNDLPIAFGMLFITGPWEISLPL